MSLLKCILHASLVLFSHLRWMVFPVRRTQLNYWSDFTTGTHQKNSTLLIWQQQPLWSLYIISVFFCGAVWSIKFRPAKMRTANGYWQLFWLYHTIVCIFTHENYLEHFISNWKPTKCHAWFCKVLVLFTKNNKNGPQGPLPIRTSPQDSFFLESLVQLVKLKHEVHFILTWERLSFMLWWVLKK